MVMYGNGESEKVSVGVEGPHNWGVGDSQNCNVEGSQN